MTIGKRLRTGLEVATGAMVFAAVIWGVLAALGFLSDWDSTVPALPVRVARR